MKPIFRLATRCDINDILKIYDGAKNQEFCLWDDNYPGINEIEQDIANDNLFVLTTNEEIIGCISIVSENELNELECFKNSKAKEIARVVVKKEYQGHNYSSLMIKEIEKVLISRGVNEIHLLVGVNNLPAYKTYMKNGFVCLDRVFMFNHEYYACKKRIN